MTNVVPLPRRLLPVLAGIVFLLATTSSAHAADLTRREKGDLAIRARAILRKHCYECHGGDANRGTMNVSDYPQLIAMAPNPVKFVAPGRVDGSQIIQLIEDGSMPPGGRDRPTATEIDTLKKWITESAPSFPAAFDDRTTLQVMLKDLDQRPGDAADLRYFSFAHLIGEDGPMTDLKAAESALQRSLVWCGVKTPPEPVDDTATLFRFDVRKNKWDGRELFNRMIDKKPAGLYSLTPYDLLLLEYPFGLRLPAGHAMTAPLDRYVTNARLVQPIPFLRADWVASALAKDTPLADDLRSLNDLTALTKKGDVPCGPATKAFDGQNPAQAAVKAKSPLSIIPLGALYAGDCQAEPPPFTLTAEAVDPAQKPLKTIAPRQPFQIMVNASQDLHFVLLAIWSDGTVVVQPTKQNRFLTMGKTLLTPDTGGPFKIDSILTGEPVVTEYFVLLASTSEIPAPPVIVRSRHNLECEDKKRHPVYRFFFDPVTKPPGFDPNRVVRKVISLTVKAN